MARGRLLKTKVREARKIAEASELGRISGAQKGHKKKELMEELREHIGLAFDNDAINVALNAALAFTGYQVFGDWKGALIGPVSLKLATSPNDIAAASGIIGLVSLGVASVGPALVKYVGDYITRSPEEAFKSFAPVDKPHLGEYMMLYLLRNPIVRGTDEAPKEVSYCEWVRTAYPTEPTPKACQ